MGLVSGFTGIDSVYEPPSSPELSLKSGELSVDDCVQQVIKLLADKVEILKITSIVLWV